MKFIIVFILAHFNVVSLSAQINPFERFNTDSTRNLSFTYEGLVISENTVTKKYGFIDTSGVLVIPYLFEDVSSFSEGLAPASLNGKYGYINRKAEIVISMQYTRTTQFNNGYAVAYNDYNCGLINTKNDTILPFEFVGLGGLPNNQMFISSKDFKSYGIITIDNTTILEANFTHIKKVFNKILLTKQNAKWQVRNIKGKLLTNNLFDEINIYEKQKLIRLKINDHYGFIDENGKIVIPFEYEKFLGVSDGLIATKKEGKWGFIDTLGNEVIAFDFDDADTFVNGYARIKVGTKYNIINQEGTIILPNYVNMISRMYPSLWLKIGRLDSFKIHSPNLTPITSLYLEFVGHPHFNRISFKKNGKYGFLNTRGQVVINNEFEEASSFKHGYSYVRLNGKEGIIDTMGNVILPIIYDKRIGYRDKEGVLVKNKKFGVYSNAQIVVPLIYEGIKGTQFGRFITKLNEKYGLVDLNNEVILPNQYDEIIDASFGYGCKVRVKEKWGFIEKDAFKITVPIIYDAIEVKGKKIIVKDGLKYGLISDTGEMLIPIEFDSINIHWKGIKVFQGLNVGLYSFEGDLLLPTVYQKINIESYPTIKTTKGNIRKNFHRSDLINKR